MKQLLETQHLQIRYFELDDWQSLHRYTSDSYVMRFLPEKSFSPEQAQTFVKELIYQAQSDRLPEKQAVILKSSGTLIGHMVFHNWIGIHRTNEIGWVFDRRYHGQGYATEAAASLLRYGFNTLNLHRVVATCNPQNVASYRVMEKIGMRCEGHFKQCIFNSNGQWEDEYFYAILKEEWLALHEYKSKL